MEVFKQFSGEWMNQESNIHLNVLEEGKILHFIKFKNVDRAFIINSSVIYPVANFENTYIANSEYFDQRYTIRHNNGKLFIVEQPDELLASPVTYELKRVQ